MRTKVSGPRAVARHISSAGCQFVLEEGELAKGQVLGFWLEGIGEIRGKVCWTLAQRVGFAFECALDSEAHGALLRHGRAAASMDLVVLA